MINSSTRLRQYILAIVDVILLYGALFLTLYLRYGIPGSELLKTHLGPFSILYFVWVIVFYSQGFYDLGLAKNNIEFWSSFLRATAINVAIGTTFFYLLPFFQITPKTNFVINTLLFSILFIIWRQAFNLLMQKDAFKRNVLFIGNSQDMHDIIKKINSNPQMGFYVSARIEAEQLNSTIDLAELINREQIKTIVVADDPHNNQRLTKMLFQCLPFQISIYALPIFYEKITGKIPINTINQIWFLENLVESERRLYETAKRITDVVIAFLCGIILIMLFPLLAILVKISSRGPIFYAQQRIGKNEKKFKLTKFRSMIQNAETDKPLWTIKNDNRITMIGKFLRRTFLDELPQLLSILKGEMSFIGPRPERPEFVAELEKLIPYYQMRHLVKPGLTGWAQINFRYGSSVEDSLEKLQYDLFYIKNRSLLLDIGIILKTIKLIFRER